MLEVETLKPNFEPENINLPKPGDRTVLYEKALPGMKDLIRKNKEELEKYNFRPSILGDVRK